jgi:hypothetical protein
VRKTRARKKNTFRGPGKNLFDNFFEGHRVFGPEGHPARSQGCQQELYVKLRKILDEHLYKIEHHLNSDDLNFRRKGRGGQGERRREGGFRQGVKEREEGGREGNKTGERNLPRSYKDDKVGATNFVRTINSPTNTPM